MKNRIVLLAALTVTLMMTSCTSEPKEIEVVQPEPICKYSYNAESTEFEWTAFKTTEKVGVAGTFNEIEVTSIEVENDKDVIESIQFSLNTASVETLNEDRNLKVAKHFFETINTETIDGSIKSLGEDGKAIVEISMNGLSIEVEGNYELNVGIFTFETTIDLALWNAISGVDALNEICKDLHTGKDGVSKLWSEVELSLKTTLTKTCE